jgi:hypothetical protein
MTPDLAEAIQKELLRPAPAFARTLAQYLTSQFRDPRAVLFYGSALRTGDRDGVLDFYVLTRASPGLLSSQLWPDVSYWEMRDGEGLLRAKVAAMTLDQFRRAASGRGVDTTIWARFVQPAALLWTDSAGSMTAVSYAMAEAARTAGRFAAALGPQSGTPAEFWRSLFRATYATELRVERSGREASLLAADPARYDRRLAQAWQAAGIDVEVQGGGVLRPLLSDQDRRRLMMAWRVRRALGRPLNVARLIKAAFTFQGAARYAAWKIERHTGFEVPLTPWRERHPILAAPGVLWRLRRARRRNQPDAR